ncbi:DUF3592 domain-containing protein [Humibacter ginsenosidimutans]|uniref:DUF3592 domain-containing protein n=1 Tax=Humibacter ginsenosidimutans TaxID=2599293 RepID=A0A5B8M2Q0_9MICO|nr:DUF3592 domain-containing protein [Humibacter ginsenosidimutans]QDZ14219.1 DUF3592 domain-containing protein [Humibacter ginsenosidimutans]
MSAKSEDRAGQQSAAPNEDEEHRSATRGGLYLTIGMLAVGAILVIYAAVMLGAQLVLATHSATTAATVVGYSRHLEGAGHGGCGGWAYDPHVAFVTSKGMKATATVSNVQICTAPSRGATLQIRYDTGNPSQAQITDWFTNWGGPLIWGVIGLVIIWWGLGTPPFGRPSRAKPIVEATPVVQESNNQRKKRLQREYAARAQERSSDPELRRYAQERMQESRRTHPEQRDSGGE